MEARKEKDKRFIGKFREGIKGSIKGKIESNRHVKSAGEINV